MSYKSYAFPKFSRTSSSSISNVTLFSKWVRDFIKIPQEVILNEFARYTHPSVVIQYAWDVIPWGNYSTWIFPSSNINVINVLLMSTLPEIPMCDQTRFCFNEAYEFIILDHLFDAFLLVVWSHASIFHLATLMSTYWISFLLFSV